MTLTAKRKLLIVEKFKAGESIAVIAEWYEQTPKRIEGVIRDFMIMNENKLKTISLLNDVKNELKTQEVASGT